MLALSLLPWPVLSASSPRQDLKPVKIIALDIPTPSDSAGGMIVADVNNDNKMDFLVTVPGHLAVYNNLGQKLWVKNTDIVVAGITERGQTPLANR
ncbi:MAG TPA: hypothetical protein EYG38_04505 [Verrucomicrobia bacterium]|jgi:hypothetical protein|nr:hypothetical protein [Verrucomicrobiota bacterium]